MRVACFRDQNELLDRIVAVVRSAGEVVMSVYQREFTVIEKADASPVTEADCMAEALIVPALQALLPDVVVVAEEAVSAGKIPKIPLAINQFSLIN